MPYDPCAIWHTLSPALQAHICAEFAAIFQEVIHVQLRGHHTPASDPQSGHLYSPVDPAPQALSHQESLRLQYALTEHAQALGWSPEAIEVVDTDLGHSAASAQHREGFNTLVGQVTLGQVGIILSYDVMRLSRNCSDW
jgi:hypothetical protein